MQALQYNLLTPIQDCTLRFDNEIPQNTNLNATTRLWIQNNGIIYKQYVIDNELSRKNIHNLAKLSRISALHAIPEIAMPLSIITDHKRILGYTMPYFQGVTLDVWLSDSRVSPALQFRALQNLASVIARLPANVYIGDLHGRNIIVENDATIHIIDIDGFSLKKGFRISCPMMPIFNICKSVRIQKYRRINRLFKISRDSDIFCFFLLFLSWIMGNVSLLMYSEQEWFRYFTYLRNTNFPKKVMQMIDRLFSRQHNYLDLDAFSKIDLNDLQNYHYATFIQRTI